MRACLFLLLLLAGGSWALICKHVNGRLKQIDASNGQVYGVNYRGRVFTRSGHSWDHVPGNLRHVTVGAAGVWGAGRTQILYRLVEGSWAMLGGQLKQVDAGGDQIIVGVDKHDDIYCANKQQAVTAANYSSPAYKQVPGKMRYYSCGPKTCWGVNAAGLIYCRLHVSPVLCIGTHWVRVTGRFVMVEVGTDGAVYGINRSGILYRRDGITATKPQGTKWTHINIVGGRFRHVSADLGALWLVEVEGRVVHCQ